MACNPCCCMKPKDGAVVCGIWSVVFAIAQLGIMGWQMAAIKYEKDRAANTLLPNYNTYGRYDIPSYYESYWQTPEERYYIGLFIIQILCLISAFFLLFAGVALIYGVQTWSRYLIMPWFVCMISSILSSLAYCIMWWAGDVRDYWLALTILEIIGVFINIFCTVVVSTFYTRLKAEWDYYERKKPYRPGSRSGHSSRRDLLENRWDYAQTEPERFIARPYPNPLNQAPPYSPYPSPYPPQPQPQLPPRRAPYPEDPNTVRYAREPGSRVGGLVVEQKHFKSDDDDEDLVSSWVKDQQRRSQRGSKADSEPPYLEDRRRPLKPSRSMPSLFEESASQRRSHRHRSSSRHRHGDRDHHDRDRDRDRDHRSRRHRSHRDDREPTRRSYKRHRSRSVADSRAFQSESEETMTDYTQCRHESRRRHSSRHRYDDSDSETNRKKNKEKRDSSGSVRLPLSGGLTIPQHIVIPPQSLMERDAEGRIQPQKFQINSEIHIKYDKNGSEIAFSEAEAINRSGRTTLSQPPITDRRRVQPISLQSNV